MSLVSGLKLKNCKLRVENTYLIKLNQSITPMDAYPYAKKAPPRFQKKFFQKEFFQKKQMGGNSVRVWIKTASSATINTCLFCWTCVYGASVKCLFSACPVFSLFFCLVVNNCIGNVCYIFLNSCMWLEVLSTNQTAGLLKIQCS